MDTKKLSLNDKFTRNFKSTVPFGSVSGLFISFIDSPFARFVALSGAFVTFLWAACSRMPGPAFTFYKIYCTSFGQRMISPIIHPKRPLPHSEYVYGIRSLMVMPLEKPSSITTISSFVALSNMPDVVNSVPKNVNKNITFNVKNNTFVVNNINARNPSESNNKAAYSYNDSDYYLATVPETKRNILKSISKMVMDSSKGISMDAIIVPLPVLNDNYSYAILSPCNNIKSFVTSDTDVNSHLNDQPTETPQLLCTLVDPVDAQSIIKLLNNLFSEVETFIEALTKGEDGEKNEKVLFQREGNSEEDSSYLSLIHYFTGVASSAADLNGTETNKYFVRCTITHILTTHKHWDHAGGNEDWKTLSRKVPKRKKIFSLKTNFDKFFLIKKYFPDFYMQLVLSQKRSYFNYLRKILNRITVSESLVIAGSRKDNPLCTNLYVKAGDKINISPTATVIPIECPGHTVGSLSYVATLRLESNNTLVKSDGKWKMNFNEPNINDLIICSKKKTNDVNDFNINYPRIDKKIDIYNKNEGTSNNADLKDCTYTEKCSKVNRLWDINNSTYCNEINNSSVNSRKNSIKLIAENDKLGNSLDYDYSNLIGYSNEFFNHNVTNQIPFRAVFTGDAIFHGGIGTLFETTDDHNGVLATYDAFSNDTLTAKWLVKDGRFDIPADHVLLYVGHEYTFNFYKTLIRETFKDYNSNIDSKNKSINKKSDDAISNVNNLNKDKINIDLNEKMLPHHRAILREHLKIRKMRMLLGSKLCTVPCLLSVERATNPLLTLKRSSLEKFPKKDFSRRKLTVHIYRSKERNT